MQQIRAAKILLVGDSTVAVSGGWGGAFCGTRVTSFLACVNLGRGGRSSGSYRAEGSWDLALAEMRATGFEPTWVLIGFGHNDQPGKPGRSTDLQTEFPENMRQYVRDIRAAGARPILFTPLTRRIFGPDGMLGRDLEPWAEATRRIAREEKVPLVDLHASSAAAVQAMGEEAADRFAQLPKGQEQAPPPAATEVADHPLARPKLSFDRTHLGQQGAEYFARMVSAGLAEADPGLRQFLYE